MNKCSENFSNDSHPSPLERGQGLPAGQAGVRSRKTFLFAGLSLAGLTVFFNWKKKPEKTSTIKFLTQDGKLVELDVNKLPVTKRIASNTDVQNWIKK